MTNKEKQADLEIQAVFNRYKLRKGDGKMELTPKKAAEIRFTHETLTGYRKPPKGMKYGTITGRYESNVPGHVGYKFLYRGREYNLSIHSGRQYLPGDTIQVDKVIKGVVHLIF